MDEQLLAVIDRIGGERAHFTRFVRSLSEEELQRPVPRSDWIVRDFVSHLATIDRPIAAWFSAIGAGAPAGERALDEPAGRDWDVDRFNDARVAERRDQPIADLLAEAARERASLIEALGRFSHEQLDAPILFGGDSKRPARRLRLIEYLQGWAHHDAIHTADMVRALPERRADPALTAWLAEPATRLVVESYQRSMA